MAFAPAAAQRNYLQNLMTASRQNADPAPAPAPASTPAPAPATGLPFGFTYADLVGGNFPTTESLTPEMTRARIESRLQGFGGEFGPEWWEWSRARQQPVGRFVPGPSSEEQDVLGQIQELLGAFSPGGQFFNQLTSTFTDQPVDFEDYFLRTVRDPLLKTFREEIQPGIGRRFGGQFYGSERRLAEESAMEDLLDALAQGRTTLAFGTAEAQRNRAIEALGMAPNLMQPFGLGLEALGLPRRLETAEREAEYGEFQRRRAEEQQRLEMVLRALGVGTVENIATAPVVKPGTEGLLPGLIEAFPTTYFWPSGGGV